MNINGNNIFLGAYAERNQQKMQFNLEPLKISEEKQAEINNQIKEAMKTIGWNQDRSQNVKVSISQEDRDFLCSKAGFEKMKQDAADLYIKNIATQKNIAAGREEEDAFWNNTGNQWLILSEHLYNNDFYTGMSNEEVKEMETMLARITSGMDFLSRTQFTTGIEFGDFYEGTRTFMTSGEAVMELESSTSALRAFADKYVSEDKREQFEEMIDLYHSHNSEIMEGYVNPYESFNKMVHDIHAGKYPNSSVLNEGSNQVVDEYKYTLLLGGISKTLEEKVLFQNELSTMFEMIRQSQNVTADEWEGLKDKYLNYATDNSQDESFRNYMWNKAEASIKHIQNYWSDLLA